jgi:hypothetical protein
MNATLDDWKNGWFGLGLGLAPAEVDALIAHLQRLKADPDQHFHIASEYKGNGGIGDIEVFIDSAATPGICACRLSRSVQVRTFRAMLSRSFDSDAQRRAVASLRCSPPVAGQLRRYPSP